MIWVFVDNIWLYLGSLHDEVEFTEVTLVQKEKVVNSG